MQPFLVKEPKKGSLGLDPERGVGAAFPPKNKLYQTSKVTEKGKKG